MASQGVQEVLEYQGRINGEYISNQVNGIRSHAQHLDHKDRIRQNDDLYSGNLRKLFPNDDLPEDPLVENKYKNALHDLARLASEATPNPVFMVRGESEDARAQARIRGTIADTIWEMGGCDVHLERKFYMDMAGAGFAAVAAFYNDESEYTQYMRLDPRYAYPDLRNGKLVSLLYVETMPTRQAMVEFPNVIFRADQDYDKDVLIITYYDKSEVVLGVSQSINGRAEPSSIVSRWVHKLGRVPVAFRAMDTFDSEYRGMFDQLGGPMMVRNKIVSYLTDYLDDMVHAPYEQKNILNGDDDPGPGRIYHHDPNADESFIRRVAPASPSGGVFGLLNYMDDQESKEATQPPSRVGSVSQSIASGSFVASTQGSLSSAVKELQDMMADLRKQFNKIAFRIEELYLNHEKPLIRAVGRKVTYTPKDDIDGKYEHRILFGAMAGVDRQYADVRLLQFQGAGAISMDTMRANIDFLDDPLSEQDKINREEAAKVLFQRFAANPNTPDSMLAKLVVELGKGKPLVKVMEGLAAEMQAQEQQAMAAQAGGPPQGQQGMTPVPDASQSAGQQQQALQSGEVPNGTAIAPISPFAPPPLQQQIVRS